MYLIFLVLSNNNITFYYHQADKHFQKGNPTMRHMRVDNK